MRILTASENFPTKQCGNLCVSMGQKSINGPDCTETSRNCMVDIRQICIITINLGDFKDFVISSHGIAL